MAYFSAGAWWSSAGVPYATQAEADAAEQSGEGASSDDDFARAMGRSSTVRAPAGAQPRTPSAPAGPLSSGQASGYQGSPNAARASSGGQQQAAFDAGNIGGAGGAGGAAQVLTDRARTPSDPGLFRQFANTVAAGFDNPLVNPIGYAASRVGGAVDRAAGTSVSGYIQDPLGQGLSDIGAPDAVQAVANPTGYATRQTVNAGTGYGTLPGATLNSAAQGFDNVRNDGTNAVNGVRAAAGAAAGYATNLFNPAPTVTGARAAPQPMPQPAMTPQSIMAQNTNTVRPSSAQQDSIVNQMIAQSGVQSGYQDFNSPQYNQTRNAAMGYTSQLANQANNNVAITGLESGRYDASRGTMNQITGQLQGQANNNVEDIQANSAQRDQSRNAVMGTAGLLTSNADNNVARINADAGYRNASAGDVQGFEDRLKAVNNVGDIRANQENYASQTGRQMGIIDQLVAMAQAQEGPSAAESLMLNAQERAVRNAYGDAGSLGGGWRSQLTGQRRALGVAASQQADIAAQIGALRANEAATFRGQSMGALGQAGSLQGDIAGRDASLAQSDAALLAQIRQGNQTNTRESAAIGGNLALGRMGLDQGLAISDADRAMLAAQGNQQNRLNSLLGAGGLQTGAMQSDTGLAQSNASLLAQIRQGNQANSLAALTAAGNNQGTTLNADLGFATNDASIRTQRELANQSNALAALQGAANAANQTAGLDANIGMNNSNNRVTVDQNNRANSIAALQNAGVLSSNTRAQDVQLSVQDSQALTQRISAAAGLTGTIYESQLRSLSQTKDLAERQRQFDIMQSRMPPAELQRLISTAGPVLGLLGLML